MSRPPQFALVGAAGFVAKRHLDAIHHVGGRLVAALDPHDAVGLLDSYFPDCDFFTEPERFDRFLNRRAGEIDYVVVCSPNWLHDCHCRWALRSGAHAICEKPLVLRPHNVDQLAALEETTGRRVYPILQLRYHPEIVKLKAKVEASQRDDYRAEITYVTRRGKWYQRSWKGDVRKSGGVATNLGVHFFDMLGHLFGAAGEVEVDELGAERGRGRVKFERAEATWFLSTEYEDLPDHVKAEPGGYAYRDLRVDGDKVADYSTGFTSLHNLVYEAVVAGQGLKLEDARPAVALCDKIRMVGGQVNW